LLEHCDITINKYHYNNIEAFFTENIIDINDSYIINISVSDFRKIKDNTKKKYKSYKIII